MRESTILVMLGSVMELPATDKQTVPLNTPQPLSLTSTLLFVGSAALQGPMCYTRRATSAMQNELWRYASLWCGQSGRLAAKCGPLASLKVHNPTQLRNYSLVLITSTNLLLACSSEPQGGPPLQRGNMPILCKITQQTDHLCLFGSQNQSSLTFTIQQPSLIWNHNSDPA